ncbi:hypothetical protein [Ponticoccus litoralis]|uniref:Uncharacterized protein n=1 Tax=Ponticoccus litoralis TaxID=422297 RepID=A0AAW9SR38_9RHOB
MQERSSRALTAANTLLDMSDTLVANAEMGATAVISSLYGDTGAPLGSDSGLEALDKLLEVDLFQMGLMYELRSRTAEVGLLINRIEDAEDARRTGGHRSRLPVRASHRLAPGGRDPRPGAPAAGAGHADGTPIGGHPLPPAFSRFRAPYSTPGPGSGR